MRELLRVLAAGDLTTVRRLHDSGALDWLVRRLPASRQLLFTDRLAAGDVDWLRRVIGPVEIPGIGRLDAVAAPGGLPYLAPPEATSAADAMRAVGPTAPAARFGRLSRVQGRLLAGAAVGALVVAALLVRSAGGDDGTASAGTAGPGDRIPATTALLPPPTVSGVTVTPDDAAVVVARTPGTTQWQALWARAGLDGTLARWPQLTLLVPTDDAFAQLDPATLERLLADPDHARRVVARHAVAGLVDPATPAPAITYDGAVLTSAVTAELGAAVTTRNGAVRTIPRVLGIGADDDDLVQDRRSVWFADGTDVTAPHATDALDALARRLGAGSSDTTAVRLVVTVDASTSPPVTDGLGRLRADRVRAELDRRGAPAVEYRVEIRTAAEAPDPLAGHRVDVVVEDASR